MDAGGKNSAGQRSRSGSGSTATGPARGRNKPVSSGGVHASGKGSRKRFWPNESALTAKGQVTIPKDVRERVGLKAGDRVRFFVHPKGQIVALPVRPASALRGMLKAKRPVTIEEMNEAVRAEAVRRDNRSRGG